jgi:hypothetical protein
VRRRRRFVPESLLALAALLAWFCAPLAASGSPSVRYEYKLVSLGSLSALQKGGDASDRRSADAEAALNEAGLDGWEMVSIFAVRTTFDPNVFFAVMKRPIPDQGKEGERQ